MTDYLTCTDTAKLLRGALKAAHPGVKFSVRSDTYAGGASIRVRWTDGPTEAEVEKTSHRYAGASFDGMIDLQSYHSTMLAGPDGEVREVHMGADYVFTDREVSDEFVAQMMTEVRCNARDSHGRQCGSCGNWTAPDTDLWNADCTPTAADFCCTQLCAARRRARHTSQTLPVATT